MAVITQAQMQTALDALRVASAIVATTTPAEWQATNEQARAVLRLYRDYLRDEMAGLQGKFDSL